MERAHCRKRAHSFESRFVEHAIQFFYIIDVVTFASIELECKDRLVISSPQHSFEITDLLRIKGSQHGHHGHTRNLFSLASFSREIKP